MYACIPATSQLSRVREFISVEPSLLLQNRILFAAVLEQSISKLLEVLSVVNPNLTAGVNSTDKCEERETMKQNQIPSYR